MSATYGAFYDRIVLTDIWGEEDWRYERSSLKKYSSHYDAD